MSRTRYAKLYRFERATTGQRRSVPTAEVRAHVQHLLASMSQSAIAAAAGVHRDVVATALYREHIYRRNAVRLLAVRRPTPQPGHYAPAIGSVRRLQALAALGYSAHQIAAGTGLTETSIHNIRGGKVGTRVLSSSALAIARFYDAHSMTPAPSINRSGRATTLAAAARAGWAPPLAWDDDTIDDPAATPCGAGYKEPSLAEQIRELAEMGLTPPAIADRLGVKGSTVERTLDRSKRRAA